MKKLFLGIFCLLLGFQNLGFAQTGSAQRAVLTGEVVGECKDIIVMVFTQDKFREYFSPKFENGNFLFEYDNVHDFVDLSVGLDDEVYGVRLYAGDSSHVRFTAKGDGTFDVDYFGKNERESRIWTDFYNTFEYWGQYNIRPDKDTNMSVAQALDLLKNNASIFNQKHSHEMDAYHFRRAELSQNFLKLLLYEDSAECSKMKAADFSEYADIISSTDPNEPLVTGCALINRWCYNVLNSMEGDDIFERSFAFIEQKFGQITCQSAKQQIAELICNNFSRQMEFTSDSKFSKVLNKLESLLPEYSEYVTKCRKSFEDYKYARDLVSLPEVTLEKPDGTTIKLSDHYGKVLYIDFWATWCGPCVRETPFMEQLAERYKDNGKIEFISISTDKNVEAWRDKVQKDNPAWPQYRIYGQEGEDFLSAINLKYIPRFLLVLPNGKVFNIDAPRPSDVDTVTFEIAKALSTKVHIKK